MERNLCSEDGISLIELLMMYLQIAWKNILIDFSHTLSEDDIICRSVQEDDIDKADMESRYIPWPNAGHSNRWNPPGVTFLYLSYDRKIRPYNSEININEYVCLLETRSKPGEKAFILLF